MPLLTSCARSVICLKQLLLGSLLPHCVSQALVRHSALSVWAESCCECNFHAAVRRERRVATAFQVKPPMLPVHNTLQAGICSGDVPDSSITPDGETA